MTIVQPFPCGLPCILNDYSYPMEERDQVETTCCELQRRDVCSDEMFKDCIEHHLDEMIEAQIKAREYFNQFKRR